MRGRPPAAAPVRTPSDQDASQTSSQTREETILNAGQERERERNYEAHAGQGVCQEVGRRKYGFRRLRSAVGGVLRTTREAADAAVQRARRFFFRDAG